MLIPIGVDVDMERKPFVNWLVVSAMCFIFVWEMLNAEAVEPLLFTRIFDKGLFTHMWLHAGPIHLIGNMIFLWVFGNAICYKLNNIFYLPAFIFLGLCAALTFTLFSSNPMLGASGAIFGIVGMYLVFFPINDITCLLILFPFCIFFPRPPALWKFSLASFWVILFWAAFNIYGASHGQGMVAYSAHLGGFFGGFVLASALIKFGVVKSNRFEKSLYDIIEEYRNPVKEMFSPSQTYEDYLNEQARNHERQQPAFIPDPNFVIFYCPCGKRIKTSIDNAGKKGRCPKCKAAIKVPSE